MGWGDKRLTKSGKTESTVHFVGFAFTLYLEMECVAPRKRPERISTVKMATLVLGPFYLSRAR
jgi:hypothetical protein